MSDDTEYWLELGKNGRIFLYDVQFDLVTTGSWVETEEGVMVTRRFLVPSDMEVSIKHVRTAADRRRGGRPADAWGRRSALHPGEDLEVPRTTVPTLDSNRWIEPGKRVRAGVLLGWLLGDL